MRQDEAEQLKLGDIVEILRVDISETPTSPFYMLEENGDGDTDFKLANSVIGKEGVVMKEIKGRGECVEVNIDGLVGLFMPEEIQKKGGG